MKEANTLQGESQSFLTTQLRLTKHYPVSAIVVFLYILIHIFQCQLQSVDFFSSFFTFQVSKAVGVQAF